MNKRSEIKLSSFFRICGREAKYSYFGAIVCQPCKMFFRRNGQKGLVSRSKLFLFFSVVISFKRHSFRHTLSVVSKINVKSTQKIVEIVICVD